MLKMQHIFPKPSTCNCHLYAVFRKSRDVTRIGFMLRTITCYIPLVQNKNLAPHILYVVASVSVIVEILFNLQNSVSSNMQVRVEFLII